MAVVIEGVGKVKPDDKLDGKSDRELNRILKSLRALRKKNGSLTKNQQSIFDNAVEMKNLRSEWRQKYNKRGANLTGATVGQLKRNRSAEQVESFLAKLKATQKKNAAVKRASRKNTGRPL